jgi:hypothetical protein
MRRICTIAFAPFIFLAGFGWHALDVIGRGDVFMKLPEFAGHLQDFLSAHQEIGYQMAPWVLMIVPIVFLAFLQWPSLLKFRHNKEPKTSMSTPSAGDVAVAPPSYLTAYQVVHYLADESQWGSQRETLNALLHAPVEFRERAAEGKLMVYGANSITHLHEPIAKTFWMSCGLDISTIRHPSLTSRTAPATLESSVAADSIPIYSGLNIEAEDVYRTWPKRVDTTPAPTGTRVATENKSITYELHDHSITIINNYYAEPKPIGRAKFKDTAARIKEYLRPGVSPEAFPQPARIKIAPDKMELLDASNVESVTETLATNVLRLLAVRFQKPVENPQFTSVYTTATCVEITSLSATLAVTGYAPIVDVTITAALTAPAPILKATLVSSPSRTNADSFVPIDEAISHVADAINDKNDGECFPVARHDLRQAAVFGELETRGRKQIDGPNEHQSYFSEVQTMIPHDYWKTATIAPLATDKHFTGTGHTLPETPSDWGPDFRRANEQYANLSVNANDLMRLWPKNR